MATQTHTYARPAPGRVVNPQASMTTLGQGAADRITGLGPEMQAPASMSSCPAALSKDCHSHSRTMQQNHLGPLAKAGPLAGAGGRRGCHPWLAGGTWAVQRLEGTQVLLEGSFSVIIQRVCVS